MESRRCHPRVSRRNAEAGANWLIRGYLWTSLRASWLTVSSVGGNAFTRWEIYTIPLPLQWFCPSDLSDGFGISSAACLPQCPSPCYYNIRWRRGGKTYAAYSRREMYELQRGLINTWIHFETSPQPWPEALWAECLTGNKHLCCFNLSFWSKYWLHSSLVVENHIVSV